MRIADIFEGEVGPAFWGSVLSAVVLGAVVTTAGPPGTGEPTSPAILERVEPPHGPFDPVLRVSAVTERFTPPANVAVSDPSGDDPASVQSEVTMFVAGDDIVLGWNDSMGFSGPGSLTGYGYSLDRGRTFTDGGDLPDAPGIKTFGDPSVVRTTAGLWIFSSLDQGSPQGLAIHRAQIFGGNLVFPAPLKLVDDDTFLDKEFLAYDAESNIVYVSYVKFSTDEFRLRRSLDGGASWSAPITVGPSAGGNGAYPIVGIDGEMYVSWVAPLFQPDGILYVRHSPDGGLSFQDTTRVIAALGPLSHDSPLCFNRGRNITWPSCDVDRTDGPFRGRLYASWCDGEPGSFDVFVSWSDDKAVSWSPPLRVNDNVDVSEQIFPQLRVSDTDGRVTVAWYDRRNDGGGGAALTDYTVAQSVDGGAYWGPNRRLSDQSVAWCGVPADITPNFGDYVALAVDDRSVFGAWGDARNGDPDVFFARKDDRHALIVSAAIDTTDTFGADGTSWFIPNVATWATADSSALEVHAPVSFVVASLGMSLLATPQENDGIFDVSGDAISGALTLSAPEGMITGTVSLSRTADDSLSLAFTAAVDSTLATFDFDPTWTTDVTMTDGEAEFEVTLDGTVTFDTDSTAFVFDVDGLLTLDDAFVPFFRTHRVTQDAFYAGTDSTRALTTHTLVEVLDVVPVEDPPAIGTNPFPMVQVGAKPNPWRPSTRVTYEIDRRVRGSIRVFNATGQLVRTLAEGSFDAGAHAIPFDGRDDDGRPLGAGGYFVRFDNDLLPVTKKLFVVR